MTVADDHLARVGTVLDELEREHTAWDSGSDEQLAEGAREALALAEALQPIVGITIKLGNDKPPGSDATADASWAASVALARRDILAHPAAEIDPGLNHDSLRLLDRIDGLAGIRSAEYWEDTIRRRVEDLVDARCRGHRRGVELRESCPDTESGDDLPLGGLLRRPADHWLRQALPTISDPHCRALIEAQITRLQPNYRKLCALDWTAEEAAADLICEARIVSAARGGWTKPVPAVVTAAITGNVSPGEQIAVRLVEDPDGPFNGKLVAFLAGERWLICARELPDGTVLPLDGTRRRALAHHP